MFTQLSSSQKMKKIIPENFLFYRWCYWHRWTTSIRDYLREFSKKIETIPKAYSVTQGPWWHWFTKETWARICRSFKEIRYRFSAWRAGTKPYLSYWPAKLHRLAKSIPRNRFPGSINIYKYGLWSRKSRVRLPDRAGQPCHNVLYAADV